MSWRALGFAMLRCNETEELQFVLLLILLKYLNYTTRTCHPSHPTKLNEKSEPSSLRHEFNTLNLQSRRTLYTTELITTSVTTVSIFHPTYYPVVCISQTDTYKTKLTNYSYKLNYERQGVGHNRIYHGKSHNVLIYSSVSTKPQIHYSRHLKQVPKLNLHTKLTCCNLQTKRYTKSLYFIKMLHNSNF